MRALKWLLLCVLIVMPGLVQAQANQDWRVVAFEPGGTAAPRTGVLDVFGPTGVLSRFVLPSAIFPADPSAYAQIVVSPDLRYAAISFDSNSQSPAVPISIIDLTSGLCCVAVAPPLPNVQGYSLAGFNADSTQLAYVYVAYTDANNYSPVGGLVTADVTSGATINSLSLAQMGAAIGGQPSMAFAITGGWTPQGVRFTPSCWACEPSLQGPWYTWDPASGVIGTVNNAYFTALGDVLPLTGELIYSVDNTNYPSDPEPSMIPYANVVEYFSGGVPALSQGGQTNDAQAPIVYQDQTNLKIGVARWVADGAAMVLQGSDLYPSGTLVFRNQTRVNVNFGASDTFLAGTPDGWLTQDATNSVNHYIVNGGAVTVNSLGLLGAGLRAVWSTPLGSAPQPPFTLIAGTGAANNGGNGQAAPTPQTMVLVPANGNGINGIVPTPIANGPVPTAGIPGSSLGTGYACPGAMPGRLADGAQGSVLPGTPNNLRSGPGKSYPSLGQIPGGATFAVLSGPVCSPTADGIDWWYVQYNSKIGWTAEGQGTEYFVQPVPGSGRLPGTPLPMVEN